MLETNVESILAAINESRKIESEENAGVFGIDFSSWGNATGK